MTDRTPAFPPLMSGHAVDAGIDPFEKACAMAALGCDAGLIVYAPSVDRLTAALVIAPEVPLEHAMAMLPACGVGFQNALGALAPPEVAVHLEWTGGIRVNGASCGHFRAAAGASDPKAMPGWLVVGLEVPLLLAGTSPGEAPDRTALYEEGCADVDPVELLEAWARHTLVWITRWEDEGPRALHAEWRGLAHGIGEEIRMNDETGTFLGVDENFGMLFRVGEDTRLIPMSTILETDA
ncbi:biotin/lipoate--protein ligase family protein [Roseovarius aestuariivivens]|uniref:biotin/lipoate--protein ligase family protein n=1 Tax=Roseovarius aestuariivivens TaxID=1888910 RepID=UPI001081051E|nr:biotin/lipoate--protein ligase family protein [Roseovarius aestuariivivens]